MERSRRACRYALLSGVLLCQAALAGGALAQGSPKTHELRAAPDTVHRGFFDASLKPVLTIDSGDIVRLQTASGNPRYYESLGVPKDKIPPDLYRVFQGVEDALRWDHTLNGPIYVTGAAPGDTLEIRIRSVDVWLPIAGQSFTPNRGLLPEDFPYRRDRVVWLDVENKTADYLPGVVLPLKPFWGVMGVAPPAAMGRVPSGPPNVFGGNMDNKDLGAGSTLYLPVHVPGALLSIGDGHAAQGHGEVCLSAIEASLQGEVQVILHKGKRIAWPRGETPTHWITMGTDTSLVVATKTAISQMVKFLQEKKGITQTQAYQAASMAADLRITQLVDGNVGVHMMIAKSYLK